MNSNKLNLVPGHKTKHKAKHNFIMYAQNGAFSVLLAANEQTSLMPPGLSVIKIGVDHIVNLY